MARKDRTGDRKKRGQQKNIRKPEIGYYLIVTDTEATERCFFDGLRESLPDSKKQKLIIKVVETKTKNLVNKCLEMTAYEPQYRIPWIVFDRDQVKNFDDIICKAKKSEINVGWSNPCFEIWMFAYFGSMPDIRESWTCCSRFGETYKKKVGQKYAKAEKNIYRHLIDNGNEEKAIEIAEQKYNQCIRNGYDKPSQMCPCTTVYELIREIKTKTEIE